MLRKLLLPFFVLCAILLVGCSKTDTMNNSNATATNGNKAATNSSSSSTTTTNSTSSSTSSAEKIGVPECDDFIAKYDACAAKVPEAGRAQYKESMEQWRKSWKQLAANPMTKGTLAAACKQAAEQQKASMKAYGCEQ